MADLFSRSFQCLLVPSRNLPQKSSERLRISAPIPLPKRSLRVTQHTHVLANSTSSSSSSTNSVPEDVDIHSSTDCSDGSVVFHFANASEIRKRMDELEKEKLAREGFEEVGEAGQTLLSEGVEKLNTEVDHSRVEEIESSLTVVVGLADRNPQLPVNEEESNVLDNASKAAVTGDEHEIDGHLILDSAEDIQDRISSEDVAPEDDDVPSVSEEDSETDNQKEVVISTVTHESDMIPDLNSLASDEVEVKEVDKGHGVDRAISSSTDGIAADTNEPSPVSSSLELELEQEQVVDNKEITHEIVDVDRAANNLTGGIDVDADSIELMPVSTILEPEKGNDEETTHLIADVDREENSLASGVDSRISELMPVSTSLEPEQVVDDEEIAHNVVDADKAENSLTAGVLSDNVDGDKAEISLTTSGVDSDIGELVAVSSESEQIVVDEETTNHITEEPFDESKMEKLVTVHDSVATPDLENKTDVGNMEIYDDENPLIPTVPESYVETASHGGKSLTTELCLISGAACLPHPSKASTGREDAYLISHPNWLGVADGVGDWALQGNNAGYYIRELMEKCENIVSNHGNRSTTPAEVITGSAAKTQNSGSSAILVAHFDGQAFHAANVGNTGFMVIRDGCIFKKSSPMFHEFSFPLQIVTGEDPSEIIEGYKIDVNDGDVIITATNGLFDNLYDQEIESVVSKSLQANLKPQEIAKLLAMRAQEVGRSSSARSPFGDAAQAAGYVGYTGGKLDNVTVIVSLVKTT